MKATLKLTNPLWQGAKRKAILEKAVQQSGAELESEIKQTILGSAPAGRTYRRGNITKAASQKNTAPGLRRVKGKPQRVIAGTRFHRASAKGQPFASDTGETLNATRSEKTGEMRNKVSNSKKHSKILDDKNKLNRPFFESTAEKFRAKFKQNIAEAIRENS